MSPKSSVTLLRALCALCHLMVTMAKEDESDAGSEPPQPTIQSQLPMLLASCVLAGLIASQAVYYDDDGDPTGLDQIPGGDRQAKLFGLWVGCGLFALGLGGLYFQSLH